MGLWGAWYIKTMSTIDTDMFTDTWNNTQIIVHIFITYEPGKRPNKEKYLRISLWMALWTLHLYITDCAVSFECLAKVLYKQGETVWALQDIL